MSVEESEPPQYIVTAPGEERNDDDDDDRSSITTTTSTATAQSTGTAISVKTTKAHNTRSQSLQSSSSTAVNVGTDLSSTLTASLMQQLKAQSTVNIVTEKHVQKFSSTQTTTSSSSSSAMATGTKSKFTSFLQHPDASSHGANFLTAQQKHVRQFVRSTSAHSSTDSNTTGISISGKSDKCIRSTSQQIDDDALNSFNTDYSKGLHQSAAILISKSAETIEGFQRSTSSTSSTSMRPHLTLSGGFLAPPANRKLTILSPVHAPPGLHEMLKKHRSPLSPRISFPGPDADLFP